MSKKYVEFDAIVDAVFGDSRGLMTWAELREVLDKVPAADVKPVVRGKWLNEELVPDNITGHVEAECSVCHVVRIVDHFCPNCGAEMEVDNA